MSWSGSPHVVPVFAAWDDDDRCFIATNANARKTRDLIASGRCVLAANTGDAHVVVEATARRVDSADEMEHASTAFREVYDWPTTVCLRRAPYAVRGPDVRRITVPGLGASPDEGIRLRC